MTEKEEKFNEIVANYPKSDFFSGKFCPDQYVGKIADFKAKEDFPVRVNIFAGQTADVCMDFSSYDQIMILVLESPHIAEYFEQTAKNQYNCKCSHPPCPAMGKIIGDAGANIRKYILEIFGDHYEDYHLILMNAVPFQCSLGFLLDPKKYKDNCTRRDYVFKKAWEDNEIGCEFFKTRFENLLAKLKNRRVIIVNACTAGDKKDMVQTLIDAEFGIIQLYHPSYNWNTKTGVQKEKVMEARLYMEKASKK